MGCHWHLWLYVNMFPFSFRTNRPIFMKLGINLNFTVHHPNLIHYNFVRSVRRTGRKHELLRWDGASWNVYLAFCLMVIAIDTLELDMEM
jgi:hypothetical protein